MKQRLKRPVALVLCLLAVLSLLPVTASAATRVTIDSQFNSEGFDYFEYYNADGQWVDLNTPKHTNWKRDRSPTVSSTSWATPTAWATARLTHLTATPLVLYAESRLS